MAHVAKHEIFFVELGHVIREGEKLPEGAEHLLKGNEDAFEEVADEAHDEDHGDDDKGHAETKRAPHRPAQGKSKE